MLTNLYCINVYIILCTRATGGALYVYDIYDSNSTTVTQSAYANYDNWSPKMIKKIIYAIMLNVLYHVYI